MLNIKMATDYQLRTEKEQNYSQRLNPNTHTYSMHFVVRHKYSASECSVRIV